MLDERADQSVVTLPIDRARTAVRNHWPLLSGREQQALVDGVDARLRGLGRLEQLLALPDVTDVLVNGTGEVWIDRDGLHRTDLVLDRAEVDLVIERILAPLGLRVDRHVPMVDARIADGSRVNIIVPPVSVSGPCLAIRRFASRPRSVLEFAEEAAAERLKNAVRVRRNIIVSGATGAGKTSLLNALVSEIPDGERIITIEDTAELALPGAHVVSCESRVANADGAGAVEIRQLVRNALRLRPDRIVVGEVRGPEALDLLWAMNSGHDGSLSTCHANSAPDALRRLETMILQAGEGLPLSAIRDHLSTAIDLVVHLERQGDRRRVSHIVEVGCRPSEESREFARSYGLRLWPEGVPSGVRT